MTGPLGSGDGFFISDTVCVWMLMRVPVSRALKRKMLDSHYKLCIEYDCRKGFVFHIFEELSARGTQGIVNVLDIVGIIKLTISSSNFAYQSLRSEGN